MYFSPPQKGAGFSKRKVFEILAPYLIISITLYFLHREAFKAKAINTPVKGKAIRTPVKANAINTAVFGTAQLVVNQLASKQGENPSQAQSVDPLA